MNSHRLYSDQLSPEEAQLGFQLVYVCNPDHGYYLGSSIVPAVVLSLGPGDRIIKLNNPMGEHSYPRQVFGTLGLGDEPDWKTVFTGLPDVTSAISAARRGAQEVPVKAASATIDLRCRKCSEKFEVTADCLPIGGKSKCPKCGYQAATEEFDSPNV